MENSTDRCLWYQEASRKTFQFTYIILTPIYFILGLIGHVLCLLAYYRQAKKEKAYMYQIFVTLSETIDITTYALSIAISAWWSGRLAPGQEWFMTCYACMWAAGHAILPVVNTFITASALFSIPMAADRIMALIKPIQYKNRNHKIYQWIALISCMGIAMLTSVVDIYRFNIQTIDQNGTVSYKLVTNTPFTSGTGMSLAHFRSLVRAATVITLMACNLSLIHAHRKYLRRIGSMQTNAGEARRRKGERTLTFLVAVQSFATCAAMSSLSAMTALNYGDPSLYACIGAFWGPITDGINELSTISSFYILLAVRKDFRRMVIKALGCAQNDVTTVVVSSRLQ